MPDEKVPQGGTPAGPEEQARTTTLPAKQGPHRLYRKGPETTRVAGASFREAVGHSKNSSPARSPSSSRQQVPD